MKAQTVILVFVALFGPSELAFAKKPISPGQDVNCVKCVDTTDIADGAVTNPKLGADVETRIGNIETGVTDNANDISQNTANVSSNSSKILENELDIMTLRTDVDSNTAAIAGITQGVQVLANGVSIGSFLQSRPHVSGSGDLIHQALSTANYVFEVYAHGLASDGNQAGDLTTLTLWYEDVGCSGPAYVRIQNELRNLNMSEQQGGVFRVATASGSVGNYYVPAGSQSTIRSFIAANGGEGCAPNSVNNVESVRVFANDSAITGVHNVRYAAPITLGR